MAEKLYVVLKEQGGWSILHHGCRSAVFPHRQKAILAALERAYDDYCAGDENDDVRVIIQGEDETFSEIPVTSSKFDTEYNE